MGHCRFNDKTLAETIKFGVKKGKDVNWNDLIGNDGDMAILWNGDNPFTGNLTELKMELVELLIIPTGSDNFVQEAVNNFIVPYLADTQRNQIILERL